MSQKSNSNSVYVTIAIGSPDPQAGDTRQIGTILQTIRLVAVKTPTEKPNFQNLPTCFGALSSARACGGSGCSQNNN